jgi:hypothetical protein
MIQEVLLLLMLAFPVAPANAQVSIGIGLPHVSIGINLPLYPDLEPIPGYPVYYAPRMDANYFFYDGLYWVYQNDNWYASSWYNGPWGLIGPAEVPLFILRVPVRYYRQPPIYFRAWYANSPPHWGEHWGHDWAQRHSGWDRWNHKSAPPPAPLPVYQREYSGDRYPGADRQHELRNRNYSYRPRDATVRRHYEAQRVESAPRSSGRITQGTQRPVPAPKARQADPQRQQRENVRAQPKPEQRETTPSRQQKVQVQPRQRETVRPQRQEVQGQPQQRDKAKAESRARSRDKERDKDREDARGRGQGRGR